MNLSGHKSSNLTAGAESGFTIVELVVVILLLGILAASALPRFMDVEDDAHQAVAEGLLGGLQSGLAMYHAEFIAKGAPDAGTQIAAYNNLRANPTGYPYGTTSETGHVVTDSDNCKEVFDGLLQVPPPSTAVAAVANVVGSASDVTAVRSATNCQYYYTGMDSVSGATIPLLTYNSTTGVVTLGTSTLP